MKKKLHGIGNPNCLFDAWLLFSYFTLQNCQLSERGPNICIHAVCASPEAWDRRQCAELLLFEKTYGHYLENSGTGMIQLETKQKKKMK